MRGMAQLVARRLAASTVQYGSLSLATRTPGRLSGVAGNEVKVGRSADGKVEASWSGGATRKAPRTAFVRPELSRWATARQPRLCAMKTTSEPARSTAAVIAFDQSSRSGAVQDEGSMRIAEGSHEVSQTDCQWCSSEPSSPGTITKVIQSPKNHS